MIKYFYMDGWTETRRPQRGYTRLNSTTERGQSSPHDVIPGEGPCPDWEWGNSPKPGAFELICTHSDGEMRPLNKKRWGLVCEEEKVSNKRNTQAPPPTTPAKAKQPWLPLQQPINCRRQV